MPMTETLPPMTPGLPAPRACWRRARLVAFPTETVYGLGGDARDDRCGADL
jgi:L-threonylcarbamoyladenylate synthase